MIKKIQTIPRECECCGSNSAEELWSYEYTTPTRQHQFVFPVCNVICQNCGFVYVAPCYASDSLHEYYADSFSAIDGQVADYDVRKRIAFIKRHCAGHNIFAEIGSNNSSEFKREVGALFDTIITVEPNEQCQADYRHIGELSEASVDIVAHYFVLEHIPLVHQFLQECARTLRIGGLMICEVPDLALYPVKPAGLQLYEHTNHFAIENLAVIAAKSGFVLQESSQEYCSRDFGFVAIFKKISPTPIDIEIPNLYERNVGLATIGKERVQQYEEVLSTIRETIKTALQQGEKLLFWAANDVMQRIVHGIELPSSVVIVDINPLKKNIGARYGFTVHTPSEVAGDIQKSDKIIICSDLNAAPILSSIEKEIGKQFLSQNIIIVPSI